MSQRLTASQRGASQRLTASQCLKASMPLRAFILHCIRAASGFALGAGVLALTPQLAHAQSESSGAAPSAAPNAEAAAHFERGVDLYNDGALDGAMVEFERAYDLVPDYRVLYNIARVHVEQNHYVDGINVYERYLKGGGSEIPEARREQVEATLEKLRARIANVWVTSNAAGADLYVNGKAVGTLPLQKAIPLDPGTCELRVEKPGYQTSQQTLKVAGGDTPRITVNLTALSTAANPSSPAPHVSGPPRYALTNNYTPFWVSFTAAALLGGGAGAFGYLAVKRQDSLDAEYDRFPVDRNRADDLRHEGKTFALVSDALTAGAILGAGLSLYFLADPPTRHEPVVDSARLSFDVSWNHAAVRGRF